MIDDDKVQSRIVHSCFVAKLALYVCGQASNGSARARSFWTIQTPLLVKEMAWWNRKKWYKQKERNKLHVVVAVVRSFLEGSFHSRERMYMMFVGSC